jgi:type-IV secretion system protein TraC
MSSNASLSNELPYWEFLNAPFPHLILWDGSLSTGIELLPIDIECFDESRINQLAIGLRSFVNSLPEGTTVQFYVKVETDFEETLKRHDGLVNSNVVFLKDLDRKRVDDLKRLVSEGSVFRPKLYFSIKTEPAQRPKAFSFSATKKFSLEFSKSYDDRLQSLSQAIEGARSQLANLGLYSDPLSNEKMVSLVYRHLNPKRAADISAPVISKTCAVEGDSPREQLVFGDLILDQEDFGLDRIRTRVLTLKTLPELTFAGMMSGFLILPFKYELFFSFHIPEQGKEMKALEQKRRMAHSLAHSTSNRVTDLESESRLSQTTDLIREIIETGQRIFQAELGIILREENSVDGRKRLNLQTKEILSRFKSLSGSEGIQETVGSWKIFKSELPLAPTNLVRMKRMKTNNLVDFLPVFGAGRGDEKPVVLTHTRLGSLYSLDPYSSNLSNFNQLCTGSSGSGKSFANNFLMAQQIARGVRLYVIDIGGSYRKLTHLMGGQYFEINLSDKYTINPFELSNPEEVPSGERIKSLVSIVEQMIVDAGEKLTRLDRVQIEEVLTKVFADARSCFPPKSPIISDVAKVCSNSPDENLKRIAKLLFPWIGDSPFGKLLDRPGKIKADSPVVAFDLKGLSQYPDLQAVMILILTNFILDQVENDRSTLKRVLLDEAWELLKSPAASSFMEYAARTFRKTGSGITFITQGVEEIISSGIGPAILNNTATKLIMLQKGDTRILMDALKLNSQELRLIQSLEQRKGVFSEGFLISGESRQVIRFQPSPTEYWVSTSDARDNQYLELLQSQGLSLEEAVLRAAEEAPFGIATMKGGTHAA